MSKKFKVACIQLNTKQCLNRNLNHLVNYIYKAIEKRAELIITPETSNIMSLKKRNLLDVIKPEEEDIFLKSIKKISKKNKIRNRSYLINKYGNVVSFYDKIHMFDVKISNQEFYNESEIFESGKEIKVANLPWGKIGMSICYDLRFPNLFRKLSQAGSKFISIPSAFTKYTGQRHWEILLRSRAIENGVYIFAPAQCGQNSINRSTYGHSLIIDPMGKIIASAKSKPGIIYARVDVSLSTQAKKMIPSWNINERY